MMLSGGKIRNFATVRDATWPFYADMNKW